MCWMALGLSEGEAMFESRIVICVLKNVKEDEIGKSAVAPCLEECTICTRELSDTGGAV